MIPGWILIALSFVLASSHVASAEDVTGVWTSTVYGEGYTDDTYPAKFHWEVQLDLRSTGSGSFWGQCISVDVHVPGFGAEDTVGAVSTYTIKYSVFGSSVTLQIPNGQGGWYNLALTANGGRMTGSGWYEDIYGTTNTWTIDVKKGGGSSSTVGLPGIAGIAGAAGIGGFLVGFPVSLLPPPRNMGGSIMPRNQTALGTPYAPSQSVVINHQLSSMANQPGGVTRPYPDLPRMPMQFDPIQFPNVQMGRTTDVRPTDIHPTDVLSTRQCPGCGSTLIVTAGGWSCPFCNRAPPGGVR